MPVAKLPFLSQARYGSSVVYTALFCCFGVCLNLIGKKLRDFSREALYRKLRAIGC